MIRRVDTAERRARVGLRHLLAASARGDDLAAIAGAVVGLHSSDPASVYLSAAARLQTPDLPRIEAEMYDERTVIRMLGMRRTMFVVPLDLAPIVQAAVTRGLLPAQIRILARLLEDGGLTDDGEAWYRRVGAATLAELERRGESTTTALAADVPELDGRVTAAAGTRWAAEVGVASRVMFLLAAEGKAVRGRPRGSWISSQYRWHPIALWVDGGLAELSVEVAQAELAGRWLRSYGPAGRDDLRWWAKWTVREVERALAAVGAVAVEMDGATGWALPDDLDSTPEVAPWVALLPALDPTAMGWKERDWYLGPHREMLFDRNGNVGPTIWSDGRIVGGWAQRPDGQIAFRLLEDVGAENTAAVETAAHDLEHLIRPIVVTPRFRTPLERELSS